MEKRDLTIRRLGADDAQAVLDYMKIIGGQSHNLTFGAEGLPFHIQAEAQFLDRYAKHPTNAQWGVWDQTELVAVASFDAHERKRMAHRGGDNVCPCPHHPFLEYAHAYCHHR